MHGAWTDLRSFNSQGTAAVFPATSPLVFHNQCVRLKTGVSDRPEGGVAKLQEHNDATIAAFHQVAMVASSENVHRLLIPRIYFSRGIQASGPLRVLSTLSARKPLSHYHRDRVPVKTALVSLSFRIVRSISIGINLNLSPSVIRSISLSLRHSSGLNVGLNVGLNIGRNTILTNSADDR